MRNIAEKIQAARVSEAEKMLLESACAIRDKVVPFMVRNGHSHYLDVNGEYPIGLFINLCRDGINVVDFSYDDYRLILMDEGGNLYSAHNTSYHKLDN